MNGGQILGEILRREGVEEVFCFPSNPMIDAAAAAGIRPIVGREERSVINMADAFTRVHNGRKIGVVMVQGGPGAEHSFGGIAQAFGDSVPLLFLPGGAGHHGGLRTSFDSVEVFRPITKWAASVGTTATLPSQLRRAFQQMRSGRMGPVVLEIPGSVLAGEIAGDLEYEPPVALRSCANPSDVTRAVEILLGAQNPMLHAGQGILWADASEELVELAELLDIPVMTTYNGKSAFPENHALSLGAGGAGLSPGIQSLVPTSDVVFSVGSSLLRTLGSFTLPAGKTIVQCTNDPNDLGMEYPIAQGVLGDAKLVLPQLTAEVRRQGGRSPRQFGGAARVAAARDNSAKAWAAYLDSDEVPINPLRVVAEIGRCIDPDTAIVTHDSGYPRDHLAPFYSSSRPRSYLGWGNTTPLGSSMGFALGASLAAGEGKVVVNVMGDAAFGQSGLDLETAVRYRLGMVCIVLNNAEMGNYEKMQPVAQERYNIKRLGGNYSEIARGLGAKAQRITMPAEIAPALKEAFADAARGETILLEFMTKAEPAIIRFE